MNQESVSPVLVTGGTGTLGRHVVRRLRERGRPVRVVSRRGRENADGIEYVSADLLENRGVERALTGMSIVIHCAGSAKGDDQVARHLVDAAARAGVRHVVYISVVGADRIPMRSAIDRMMFGYFGTKLAAERIIADSGVPWTTLRATQFHDLLFNVVQQMSRLPVIPVPAVSFQPIEADEVAARLVELALAEPAGLVPDLGGARVYELAELIRSYLAVTGKRRALIPMPLAGAAARAFRQGANLAPDRAIGVRTWEEFLSAHTPRGRD